MVHFSIIQNVMKVKKEELITVWCDVTFIKSYDTCYNDLNYVMYLKKKEKLITSQKT